MSYNLYGHKHERGILKLEGRYEKGTAVTTPHVCDFNTRQVLLNNFTFCTEQRRISFRCVSSFRIGIEIYDSGELLMFIAMM